MSADEIAVVSGLPRSGTSMMMKMFEAGGWDVLTDNLRQPDQDNPHGYYEFEPVKQIEHDRTWLPQARGKVVKIISMLLRHLPAEYTYRIVFMRREMAEILASQRQMLVHRGRPVADDDSRMGGLFERHLREVEAWMSLQPNIRVLYVSYNDIVQRAAEQAQLLNQFVDQSLDVAAMLSVVDQTLHRQRTVNPDETRMNRQDAKVAKRNSEVLEDVPDFQSPSLMNRRLLSLF